LDGCGEDDGREGDDGHGGRALDVCGEKGIWARGANWEASRVRVAPGRVASVLRLPGSRRMAAPWSIRVVAGARNSTALR